MVSDFHKRNRTALVEKSGGIVYVFTAYDQMQHTHDQAAPFIQEANFWWLTGIEEAGWKVVIDGNRRHSTLVRPYKSETHELFDGALTAEDAIKISGADEVIEEKEFESCLRNLAKKHTLVYTAYDKTVYDFISNPAQRDLHVLLERIFTSVQLCNDTLYKLRAIKQSEEIKAIENAVKLTAHAFTSVKEKLSDMKYEYEIEAEFDYIFKHSGQSHAYAPIVASGKNACTLHYSDNNQKLKKGSFVLMDIGARVSGYAADITRTYAYGEPTKRQIAVHEQVKNAHEAIIDMLAPDLGIEEYQRNVMEIMGAAVAELGLVKSPQDEKVMRYFPHAVSHGLGIDVHDALGRPRYFQPGMVLTVEPGIYIPEEAIGIRIEDDLLVTEKGHRNLSRSLSTGW